MHNNSLTDNELALWLRFIEYQVGFILPGSQVNWIRSVIERHMQAAQLDSIALLAAISQDQQYYHQFFDDILIPRTEFFRHLPTFDFIEQYASVWRKVHPIQTENQYETKFKAWSVGCSTGQEAVTLALILQHVVGLQAFAVFGSDFHQQALAQARMGQYEMAGCSQIPSKYHPWLQLTAHHKFQVLPMLLQHITYFSQNLVRHGNVPQSSDNAASPSAELEKLLGQCQVIVCKNVLIYFRQFEQRDIVDGLIPYLAQDGILLLGVGELAKYCPPGLQRITVANINGFCREDAPSWLTNLLDELVKN